MYKINDVVRIQIGLEMPVLRKRMFTSDIIDLVPCYC